MKRSPIAFARNFRSGPITEVAQGTIKGKALDKGCIDFFAGIPYAAPPVGGLRWRAPEPAAGWSGTRDCSRPGPIAHQRSQSIDEFMAKLVGGLGLSRGKQRALLAAVKAAPKNESEDCLTLNIRAPHGASGLPVMVWIHGGDHTDGASSEPFYASNALPSRGCILVTINYRLGLMGFLAHPELASESPDGVSGNYGLMDQIAALQWVRDNIESFGGDPKRVTIFGESAGGEAVLNLLTAPRARGLFHAAIAQSPSDTGRWLHLRQSVLELKPAESAGEEFARSIVGAGDDQIERMRDLPADELYERYRADPQAARYFYPAVDGTILPTTPMTAFSLQTQAPVPLMIGYNTDEGSLLSWMMHPAGAEFGPNPDEPVSQADMRLALEQSYGSAKRVDQLFAAYPGLEQLDEEMVVTHCGDHMFGVHVDHASRQHAAAGHSVYRYLFAALPASPKQSLGAFHAAEVFYVFDTSLPMVPRPPDAHLLVREMGDRWFAFAATHRPDSPGRESWPIYDPAEPKHLLLDRPRSSVERCPAASGLDLMRDRVGYLTDLIASDSETVDLRTPIRGLNSVLLE